MSSEVYSPLVSITTKKVTPTRRAVDYFKVTWRRLSKTPGKISQPLRISSPIPFRNRSGACKDRTQLNDVISDDDLTIIPSNVSYGASTTSSELSPIIQDSDWRYFIDTPMRTSPSTYLGSWSKALCSSTCAAGAQDDNAVTDRSGIIKTVQAADNRYTKDKLDAKLAGYLATPPASAAIDHSKKGSFLHSRALSRDNNSSCLSVATPTPAVRAPAHSLRRRASDFVLGDTAVTSLDQLVDGVRADNESHPRPSVFRTDSADISDKWSFVSIRGESTTNDLLQYDTSELPANKRRKVSLQQTPTRVPVTIGKRFEDQSQLSTSSRAHPRYSSAYSLDPHRRVLDTPYGPAVFMTPKGCVNA